MSNRAIEIVENNFSYALLDADTALLSVIICTLLDDQMNASIHLNHLYSKLMIDKKGWGLPYDWNSFSDEEYNSASTIYTYTTAMGVHASLDYLDKFGIHPPQNYLDAIGYLSVLSPYYSSALKDRIEGRVVWNVEALSIGALSRVGIDVSGKLERLIAAKTDDFWPYMSAEGSKKNDVFHECLLLYGLRYVDDERVQELVKESLQGMADKFLGEDSPFNGNAREDATTFGSLLWGPAILSVMFSLYGMEKEAKELISHAVRSFYWGTDHPRSLAWYGMAHALID